MDFEDYRRHDATGLAALVDTGEVSPAELLAAARARAEEVNPDLNAIVADVPCDPDEQRSGPFAGVPFLLKDLDMDYAGLPTSRGSRSMSTMPATEHATIVQRWLDAGLLVFGKTNLPELGAKGITEPELWGPTRNPWDLDRSPGGSSGGAAAAVAAGIVPAAAANDGGGSIRIPAACCGLVGLKPSRGLTPMGPTMAEAMHGSAVHGTVTRTVRDTARLLDAVVGGEPWGPYVPHVGGPFADAVGRDPGRLRIGLRVPSAITPDPDPEAWAAAESAATALRDLGHEVVELDEAPYDDEALAQDFLLTWFVSLAADVEQIRAVSGVGDSGFEADTLVVAALGRATSALEYVAAVERRHTFTRQITAWFDDFDLLLTPTLATPPPRIGEFDLPAPLRVVEGALVKGHVAGLLKHTPVVHDMVSKNLGWVPYTQLANVTGRPAISLPLHWTADGLPLGVQLVATIGADALLLSVAAQLEEAVPWFDRVPSL